MVSWKTDGKAAAVFDGAIRRRITGRRAGSWSFRPASPEPNPLTRERGTINDTKEYRLQGWRVRGDFQSPLPLRLDHIRAENGPVLAEIPANMAAHQRTGRMAVSEAEWR
jgi:hypothetical protein